MAFVIEEIPEEAKKKYNFGIGIKRWVIDHERNIFMIPAGGDNYGKIKFFNMYVGNEIAGITAEEKYTQIRILPDSLFDVKYTVINVSGKGTISWQDIPTTQSNINCSPKQLVEEALRVYGYNANHQRTNKTEVQFQEYTSSKSRG